MTAERWAGNGGQMAERKQKKQKAVSKAPGRSTGKNDPCSGGDLGCSLCLVGGAKTLRQLVCHTVEEHGARIAKSLLKETLKGDVSSAKLLISLAEPRPEKEGTKKKTWRGQSLATALAAEPQWRDEETEGTAETGFGDREPAG
jgi:hypothetical protein